MSIGLGKSQLESNGGAVAAVGKLSGAAVAAPSATVNLSTIPGIIDWFVFNFLSAAVPSAIGDLTTSFHWRKLGGLKLLQSFRWYWQTDWFIVFASPATPPTAFSANASDDGSIDNGGSPPGPNPWPMTGAKNLLCLRAANSINFPDDWGFSLRVPALTVPTQLDLYLAVHNLDLQVLAHLTDGSAPDVTVTISESGGALAMHVVSFIFNSANPGSELIINTLATNTQDPSIASSQQGFQAAILHF